METTEQEAEREERPSTQSLPTSFVGREEILDTIKRHLLKGQHVCLYGDHGGDQPPRRRRAPDP
jgi:hypothetical protein